MANAQRIEQLCVKIPHSKPMSITPGRLHRVYIKINISFERESPFTSEQTFRARMDLESIMLYLAMKYHGALEIHAEINNVLDIRIVNIRIPLNLEE
jgi:hypothetical protein